MKLLFKLGNSALALALAGGMLTGCSDKVKETEAATPAAVDVAEVVVDSVMLHATYPGYLSADQEVNVVARVSGTLMKKLHDDGEYVRKGQPLFIIESTQYADRVRQAEATLESSKSAYEYASSRYAAVKRAMESDAVSQMELEQAESNMKQAEASIKSAQASLELARLNLGYCTVTAPVSGRVTSSTVGTGSFVSGDNSSFVLTTIYDDTFLTAVFNIDDASLVKLLNTNVDPKKGEMSKVKLNFDEQLGHEYTATITYIAPNIDTSTGSAVMKAKVANNNGELRNGMFVKVSLPTAVDPKAILVKDASIATDQLGRYVYTVNDSNRVVYTPVKVGELVNDTMRIITEGLQPGARYVTKALLKVRNGETVKPVIVK